MRQDTLLTVCWEAIGLGLLRQPTVWVSAKLLSVVDLSSCQGDVLNNPFASRGEVFVVQRWICQSQPTPYWWWHWHWPPLRVCVLFFLHHCDRSSWWRGWWLSPPPALWSSIAMLKIIHCDDEDHPHDNPLLHRCDQSFNGQGAHPSGLGTCKANRKIEQAKKMFICCCCCCCSIHTSYQEWTYGDISILYSRSWL